MTHRTSSPRRWAQFTLAAVVALAASAYAAPATQKYNVYELPRLNGIGGSPRAIDNHGVIAGGSYLSDHPNIVAHAVTWQDGKVTDVGAAFGNWSQIEAMNQKGVMGGYIDGVAHIWKHGRATPLPFPARISAINGHEAIVGSYWASGTAFMGPERAYIYRDGVLRDLGTLTGHSFTYSQALSVNDKGIVVGYSVLPFSQDLRAVLWIDGVIKDLGGLGGQNSIAGRINNHGVIIGTAETPEPDRKVMMVSWNVDGHMQVLGESMSPMAINDRNQIVGNNLANGKAFLYEDGNVTWLSDLPEVRAGGWVSFAPFVINDRGWIAGPAWKPGITTLGTGLLLVPVKGGGDFGKK